VGLISIFKVFSSHEISDLKEELRDLTLPDIYYYPEFLRLCDYAGEGEGFYAVYNDSESFWIYPFMRRSIRTALDFDIGNISGFDIFSPYGYSGPVNIRGTNKSTYKNFRSKIEEYFSNNHIVSEFIRFHPLINNDICEMDDDVKETGKIVYFDLKRTHQELEKDLSSSTKRNLKKAERNDLKIFFDFELSTMEEFIDIYNKTMDRVGASENYYFPKEYYQYLKQKLNKNTFIANIKKETKTIASALFFATDKIVQYHLGGSLSEYLKYRPNDFMFYKIALWAKEQKYKFFNLGGGVGGKVDSLFRFKKSFSKETAKFYTGRKIIDNKIYNELKKKWISENNVNKKTNFDFFPIYRKRF